MNKVRSDRLEHLNDEQLDKISAYSIPYHEDNLRRIKENFWQKTGGASNEITAVRVSRKKNKRIIPFLIAASLAFCFALTGFAMSGVMDIEDMYRKIFNSPDQSISQYGAILNSGNTSNGIDFKTVAAINDNKTAYVIFTLTDQTGDRLSSTVDFYDDYRVNKGSSFTMRQIAYDPQTRTATFYVMFHGGDKLNGKKINFRINSFLGQTSPVKTTDIQGDIYDYLNTNPIAETIYTDLFGGGGPAYPFNVLDHEPVQVLEKNKIDMQIPGLDWAHISNIGFIDGKLHIQLSAYNEYNYIRNLYFVDEHDEKKLEYEYSVSFGRNNDGTEVMDGKYNRFTEFIYDINDISKLKGLTLKADYVEYGGRVEGSWKSIFKLASKMDTIELADSYSLPGQKEITLEKITISPLSVTLDLQSGNEAELAAVKLRPQVQLKDGAIIDLEPFNIKDMNPDNNLKYVYAGIIPLENVEAVLIDGHPFRLQE